MKRNKKPLLIGALAVLLVALVVGGTIAWLTAEDKAVNTFTVGTFGEPTDPPKTDEGNDEDEDQNTDEDAPEVDGFLFETEWTWTDQNKPKLMEGVPIAKNPNVGVSKNSDDPYVFIYVKNNAVDTAKLGSTAESAVAPYFKIEDQWAPVTTTVDSEATDVAPTASTANGVQVPTSTVSSCIRVPAVAPRPLRPSLTYLILAMRTTRTRASCSRPSPSRSIDTNMLKLTDGDVTVYAYIYAADTNADGNATPTPEEGSANAAVDAAIAWAKGLK